MFRSKLVAFTSGASLVSVRCCSVTPKYLLQTDPLEHEREAELRRRISEKYRGMPIPEMTNPPYGQFATGGTVDTARVQAFGFSTSQQQGRQGVDWIMLLTGCVLVYYTGKIIFQRSRLGVDGIDAPLAIGSIYNQAQHLIFNIQYDKDVRESLKKEYQSYKKGEVANNRLAASFFDYVQSRMPDFCSGRVNPASSTVQIVVNALGSDNSRILAAFARSEQASLWQKGGDPQTRVDDFINKIGALNTIGIGSAAALNSAGSGMIPLNTNVPPPQAHPMTYSSTQPVSLNETLNTDSNPNQVHGSVPFQNK